MSYFETTIKYESLNEQSGKVENVKENYLLKAINFSDAELQVHKYVNENVGCIEFFIESIKRSNITEVIERPLHGISPNWFKIGIKWIQVNEKTGKETGEKTIHIVNANDFDHARAILNSTFSDIVAPFEISSITQFNLIDVIS